jgi:hypothetical protein
VEVEDVPVEAGAVDKVAVDRAVAVAVAGLVVAVVEWEEAVAAVLARVVAGAAGIVNSSRFQRGVVRKRRPVFS